MDEVIMLSDNNKYIVVKKIIIDNIKYAYLLKVGEDAKFSIARVDGDELSILNDSNEIMKVLLEISKDMAK